MQENYLISIVGLQRADGETGEVKLTTLGSYITKGTNRFIIYKEYNTENSKLARTSILKVEDGSKVTLMRGGADNTRMILEKGKRHLCQYDTGYGSLMVGIYTNDVACKLDDSGGTLEVNYTLDINSDLASINELYITIKEAANKDVKISAAGDQ